MRYILLLFLVISAGILQAQSLTFAFKGAVSNQDLGKNETGVMVTIVQGGNTLGTATSASNGKYSLKGNVNYKQPFSVVFSKGGMVSKKVDFNFSMLNEEDVPAGSEYQPISDLSMSIFSERPNIDFSFLKNEPVAIFNWNESKLTPDLDKVTSDKMRARIEKLLLQAEQNNSANDAKYQAAIKEADNLYLSLKKYPEARTKYEEALALKPKEKYPSDKIVELDALIAAKQKQDMAAQQSDVEYLNLIKAADALRDQKKYDQAILKYKEASAKKNEQYPKDQVTALQKMVDDQKKQSETDAKFNDAIKAGDLAMTQKNYTLAKEKYTLAKDLKPSDQLPVTRLSEIDKKMAEQTAVTNKKKKYDEAIAAADKFFAESKYADAKGKYSEALTYDPAAVIPPNKIKECDAKIATLAKDKEKADKISKLLSEGNTLLAVSKLNEAKLKYNEVLTLDPTNPEAKQKIDEINLKQQDAAKSAEQDTKFTKLVSEGDLASKGLKYTEAKTKYEAALQVKSDPTVQTKIEEINKKLKDQEDKASQDAKFLALKSEGMKLANEQKYEEAKAKLTEAQSIKADVAVAAKLKEIDEKLKQNDAASKLDKNYQDIITAAQGLESAKDYDGAILKYKEAAAKKPLEKLPKDRIAALELLKLDNAKQKEVDAKYVTAMKRGDDFMAQQKYIDAIKEYNAALVLKPNESLPVTKAKEAEELEKNKGSEDKKQYEKIIGGIEKAIAEKDFTRGKELVERAKSYNKQFNIMPSDTRPNDLLAQINLLEQAEKNYTAKMAEGEKFATAKDYPRAIAAYEAAKIIRPAESLPQNKIDELKKLQNDQASVQEKELLYKDNMTKGNLSQNAKNYAQALTNYENALSSKPNDQVAKDKISEVKQLMDEQANATKSAQDKRERFDALIKEADLLFRSDNFSDARAKYQEAIGVDPTSKYAKKQLDECNRKQSTTDNAKAELEFNALVKTADDAFKIKSFDRAKDDYNRALVIKPGNPYVTNKLKEIDAFLNPAIEKTTALEPLGKPYESSIMDGYAALVDADIQRKSDKEQAIGGKLKDVQEQTDELTELSIIEQQRKRDQMNAVVTKIASDEQSADLNRQLTTQVFEKAQNDIANENISNENFEHSENVKSQDALYGVAVQTSADYKDKESVYTQNTEIINAHNVGYEEGLRQQSISEANTNITSGQKLLIIDQNLQQDRMDDSESRSDLRNEVNKKLVEVNTVEQNLTNLNSKELIDNDQQLTAKKIAVTLKDEQDSKVAPNNDAYLKSVKEVVNEKDQSKTEEQVVHTSELNSSINKINTSIDEQNVDRDLNRLKTTEIIHNGNETIEKSTITSNQKENTKYLSNESVINNKGALANQSDAKSLENHTINVQSVALLDKKANTSASDLNLSDEEERLQARSTVETMTTNVEESAKSSTKNQEAVTQKFNDASKAVDASNASLQDANKEKNLSNQSILTVSETNRQDKVKLANSLGKEYPEGVSQESFTKNDDKGLMTAIITRRIVVKEGHGDVYVCTQTLQAITYSKNGQPTTEMVWQRETQGPHLQKHY
jgi:epidermal growth factor receptor substrate 15